MVTDDKSTALLQQVVAVATQMGASKVVLFGSRARGDATDKSDFDLAIYGAPSGALVNEAIDELDTLHKLDVVHITSETASLLLDNIKKDGVVLMDKLGTKRGNYLSAITRLNEACAEYTRTQNDVVRDGVIQRFEFTTELGWKVAREYLLDQGYTDINSPKAVMKAAFAEGLVTDETGWVELLNARNTTSHIYDAQQAAKVYAEIDGKFVALFESLADKLV